MYDEHGQLSSVTVRQPCLLWESEIGDFKLMFPNVIVAIAMKKTIFNWL